MQNSHIYQTIIGAPEIAARLGLKRVGRDWRGNCPVCGYGAGAFVLTVGKSGRPMGWCASCQDREGIASVIGGEKMPQATAAETVRRAADNARKRDRPISLWNGSEPTCRTPGERYLSSRGLSFLAGSEALRYRGDTSHPTVGPLPAMIALVSDMTGTGIAVHRTYLRRDGMGKASVEPAKASLGPIWGGAIRLSPIEPGRRLVIGEGIETAASAGLLLGCPAWSALSAGNLAAGLVLPPEARRVTIAADPDDAGRNAARDAWLRWTAEGRDVRIVVPDGAGDFNDVLMARGAGHE